MIVGKFVGKEALAAVGGPAATLINLLIGFFTGLSSGATVIIAQYYGAEKVEDVKKTVHTAMALSIAGGAVIMVLGILFFGGGAQGVDGVKYLAACGGFRGAGGVYLPGGRGL